MTFRHLRAGIAVVFLALAAVAGAGTVASRAATVGSPSSSGRIGIKLLEVPSSQVGNPRDEQYIVDNPAPGEVITRKFEVLNLGGTSAQVTVYPAAATISGGTFRFANGDTQDEMTTWISISHSTLTLAPHSNASLVATITVPSDAPSGEQYGVIWAQVSARGAGNVKLVSRVGIRVYLSIGPGGAAAPDFTLGTPVGGRTAAGVPFVSVPVHNTGGTAVDVQGTLQLTDGPGGVSAGPFHAKQVDTLAPGQSYPATFALSAKLPTGPWQATFTMVSGLITKTETVTLKFNGAPATAAHHSFPVVLIAAAIAAVIIIVVIALLITRSRRSRRSHGTRGTHGTRRPTRV
jgi:hypothetical protein